MWNGECQWDYKSSARKAGHPPVATKRACLRSRIMAASRLASCLSPIPFEAAGMPAGLQDRAPGPAGRPGFVSRFRANEIAQQTVLQPIVALLPEFNGECPRNYIGIRVPQGACRCESCPTQVGGENRRADRRVTGCLFLEFLSPFDNCSS